MNIGAVAWLTKPAAGTAAVTAFASPGEGWLRASCSAMRAATSSGATESTFLRAQSAYQMPAATYRHTVGRMTCTFDHTYRHPAIADSTATKTGIHGYAGTLYGRTSAGSLWRRMTRHTIARTYQITAVSVEIRIATAVALS